MPDIFELIQQLCPDGVEYRQTDELFALRNGYTPSKSNDSYWSNGTVPWFRLDDIAVNGRLLSVSQRYVSSDAVKGDLFPAKTIIVSTSATIGEHALILVPFLVNQRFTCLSLKEEYKGVCDIRFLFYVTFLFSAFCKSHCHRGNMLSVDMNAFRSFRWPLPPLPVQQEIVRILDAFDTYCNDMTSGLAGELAMRRKQFQYWRETLIAQQTDHMVALGDLGQFQNGHGISKSELMDEGPVPVIHYGQIYTMYNHAVLKTVSFAGTQTAVSVKAHHGDVVVCLTDTADLGFVGKAVAQVSGVDVGVSGDAGVLHLNPEEVDASYLAYVMETQRFQVQKEKCKRGTTVMHLNIPMWKKIRVPVPPLAVQLEIVHILDVFMELERELERELELRVKQFEYYRDRLLVFPGKSAA